MNSLHHILFVFLFSGFAVGGLQDARTDEFRLVFRDIFDRDETQAKKDEVGNGWVTNGDKPWARSPKQTDLRDGALHVVPVDADGSGVLIIRPWEFHDGTIKFRFMLPEKRDSIGIVIADKNLKDVHAGHVMSVTMKPGSVKISDMLSGAFAPEIWRRRKAKQSTPEDKDQIKKCIRELPAEIGNGRWHQAAVSIQGDRVEVVIDRKSVGSFQSPGFANLKTTLRMTFRNAGVLDDVELYEPAN